MQTLIDFVTIYALVDPRTDEVRYVGKASDPVLRLRQHLTPGRMAKRSYKNHWLRELTREGLMPRMEILDSVESDRVDQSEREWIAFFRKTSNLTNMTDGGEGGDTGGIPPTFYGEDCNLTKLTDTEVREIREAIDQGESSKSVAERYGVTAVNVWMIATGKTRKTADGPIQVSGKRQKLTDDDVRDIRSRYANGEKQAAIVRSYGVSQSCISLIVNNHTRRNVK